MLSFLVVLTMAIYFSLLSSKDIPQIVPLMQLFNEDRFSAEVLQKRLEEMFQQHYECVGVFEDDLLIGVTGLWYQTRHYSGRSCEVDHVYIDEKYRSGGIGKKLFSFIETHIKNKGCETIELNTYVQNAASHKFYFSLGFKILGFHFLKKI